MLFCRTSASLRAHEGVEVRRSDRFRSFARGTHAFAPIQLPLKTNLMVPLRPQLMGTSVASEGCRLPPFYGFSAHLSSCSRPKSSSMGWTNLLKCDSTCAAVSRIRPFLPPLKRKFCHKDLQAPSAPHLPPC